MYLEPPCFMVGSRTYIEICSTEFNAIPAALFPFHCGKIIQKSASKKNGITLRRIRKFGVLTLFKQGTRNKFLSIDMRGFFTRSLLWFPQILVIIAGTGI